ncbi:MAG TPA: alpha/beta hydrolase [Myxococcaceae bacterium]|nr:alpha/beta hydrolase [Myxococcaceae bacterium]
MPEVSANGIRIHYQDEGEGPPVVLVSGLSYGAWTWRWVAPLLASTHRVIRLDNRGVDGSDQPPGPYTTALMAQDLLGVMEALQLPPCGLVGISLGGFIVQEAALARPDRVARLVLMATSFGGPKSLPPTPAALEAMTNREGGARAVAERSLKVNASAGFAERHPDRAEEYFRYRDKVGMTGDSYRAQLLAGATHDAEARVSGLKMPVLILQGDQDLVIPPGNAELLKARISQAEVKMLPGAGHLLPMERPEEVAEAMHYFLSAASFSR